MKLIVESGAKHHNPNLKLKREIKIVAKRGITPDIICRQQKTAEQKNLNIVYEKILYKL